MLARLFLLLALLAPALPADMARAQPAPAAPAKAAGGLGSAYAVGGIDVDVTAANPQAARLAAYRIAQRKAWPLLWARLTGNPPAQAPKLSDGALDGMVSGIESQGERFSMTRYIARLAVIFDRSRAAEYFGGMSGGTLQSPPMLLMPVYSDGGVRVLYQQKTPWAAAWQRYRENVTPIDYVIAPGTAADNLLLTAWQVNRPDRQSWRNILNRFDTVDVLTAEARLTRAYPGGPVRGLFIARHGPDAAELGRFSLMARSEEGLNTMLDAAVLRIDGIYAEALRSGRLQSEAGLAMDLEPIIAPAPFIGVPEVVAPVAVPVPAVPVAGAPVPEPGAAPAAPEAAASVEVALATPDAASVRAAETALRGTVGVAGITTTSLSLGGTSRILISYRGGLEALRAALDARGFRLASEGGTTVLRRRREGDPPLATAKPAP